MTRFVAIGNLNGAFKRPRLLGDANQTAAIESYERELGVGEIVVWRGAEARVAPPGYRAQRSELVPQVSAMLRKQLRATENDEALQSWRMGTAKNR
jgi:hypothetical protein